MSFEDMIFGKTEGSEKDRRAFIDYVKYVQDSVSAHFQDEVIKPIRERLALEQEAERSRLNCRLEAGDHDGTAERVLSQRVPAFDGQTLEAVIRKLQDTSELREANKKIKHLEGRIKRLESKEKLVRWCAKRIRRMLRVQHQRHIDKSL